MLLLRSLSLLSFAFVMGCAPSRSETKTADTKPDVKQDAKTVPDKPGALKINIRCRPASAIRLGGVFFRGVGNSNDPLENSASNGTKLSDDNRDWIVKNCDVAAFNAVNIAPDTFRTMTKAQPLFTPLLYVYASTLYEQDARKGNAGGWKPEMQAWTLRDTTDKEVSHPDLGAHWMDFGNEQWAAHWHNQVTGLSRQYGAEGAVMGELPLGNTFVTGALKQYKTDADKIAATGQWLKAARQGRGFLMIPSAIGFDSLAGHTTLPTPPGTEEPELSGRLWDEYHPFVDGAWAEGWITPYWTGITLPDNQWELHVEAADRAARNDQVFIAGAAYHNDEELEYLLATYLMSSHLQGRFVLQPMPLRAGQPEDAGYSLAVFRKEVEAKANFFNAPVGIAMQERHPFRVEGGDVWRRAYGGGDVYVNSDDKRAKRLHLGGPMKRLNGAIVKEVDLEPHTGVILLYPEDHNKPAKK